MPNTATHIPVQASDETLTDTAFTIDTGTGDLRVPFDKRIVIEGDGADSFIGHGINDLGVSIKCAANYIENFENGIWTLRPEGGLPLVSIDGTNSSASFGDNFRWNSTPSQTTSVTDNDPTIHDSFMNQNYTQTSTRR